jgi:3-deoxy-D-manno-octulosonate 8-phosphate phosphatase (KDO 8-P phosphatase)
MTRAGLAVTVPGAPEEVSAASDWVTRAAGGRGAVREVCDLVLKSQGRYAAAIAALIAAGPAHKETM